MFRIGGFTLAVPPLRDRAQRDHAARRALRAHGASAGTPMPRLSDAAQAALVAYGWPGNVRELRNAIERALVLCDDAIELTDLPEKLRDAGQRVHRPPRRPPPTCAVTSPRSSAPRSSPRSKPRIKIRHAPRAGSACRAARSSTRWRSTGSRSRRKAELRSSKTADQRLVDRDTKRVRELIISLVILAASVRPAVADSAQEEALTRLVTLGLSGLPLVCERAKFGMSEREVAKAWSAFEPDEGGAKYGRNEILMRFGADDRLSWIGFALHPALETAREYVALEKAWGKPFFTQ